MVVTFLDMLRFAAENFWKASQIMTEWGLNAGIPLPPGKTLETMEALKNLQKNVADIGLVVSAREIQKLNVDMGRATQHIAGLPDEKKGAAFKRTSEELRRRFDSLSSVIHSELESRMFLYIPQEESSYYDQKELFGTEVIAKFPTIQYDMVEAGNCYAASRSTACVFHLMRIMEVGVQVLGTKLGVSFTSDKNWQNILDEINKSLKSLPAKDASTKAISEASANLYAVKLAWRNQVMHPHDTYTLEEAKNLLGLVKIFMGQLSSVV